MTSKGTTDLGLIAELCQNPGPFLSAYCDISRDVEEAEHHLEVRWRSAQHTLVRAGAPRDLVDRVGERMLEPVGASGKAARMIVACEDGILTDDVVPQPHADEALTWGPLPDMTGWLADRSAMLPILVVLADRQGADFELYDAWPRPPRHRESVQGDTEHLTKVAGGEWAHKQYQRRAQKTWRQNAKQVAAEIDEQAQLGVRLVAVAGDVRACDEVRSTVSEASRSLLVELDTGGRSAGSSREALDRALDDAVHNVVEADLWHAIREFEKEAGRDGAAATGVAAVLECLSRGQVRAALLAPGPASSYEVRVANRPDLALPASAFQYEAVRADLAVLCAAAATDADVVVTPHDFSDDGVVASLRWHGDQPNWS